MHHGDLSADYLIDMGLSKVSPQVDPYTLTRLNGIPHLNIFRDPLKNKVRLLNAIGENQKTGQAISAEECVDILWDEFENNIYTDLTTLNRLKFFGGQGHLFQQMLHHMKTMKGAPFSNHSLDHAFKTLIESDRRPEGAKNIIRAALSANIDWKRQVLSSERLQKVKNRIAEDTYLPKFNRCRDYVNGTLISVHDIYALKMTLTSLTIKDGTFNAIIHFKGQDHFGLDEKDMGKNFYFIKRNGMSIFKIWFILQRYKEFKKFDFKPFFTNMNATITISGRQDDVE